MQRVDQEKKDRKVPDKVALTKEQVQRADGLLPKYK